MAPHPTSSSKSFFIVGIGASAGGLEALELFFNHLSSFEEAAIIIVQHLSPDFKSLMVEILSKHTTMKVVQVQDGMEIEKGYVYLIPPKKLLILDNYKLYLTERELEHGPEFTIDKFFYSLANAMQEKAIAIILSGTGSDGSRGIKVVKQLGGTVMVQSEDSARFDGMPRNAILSGAVDYVLPPEKMPEMLRQCIENKKNNASTYIEPSESDIDKLPPEFSELVAMVYQISKIDYKYYKPGTIYRQIVRRMQNLNIDSFQKYIHFIESTPSELTLLSRNLLIGVTSFFRDKEAFDLLEAQIIPQLFVDKKPDEPIRVWVAGCSSGEEAYSIAILFKEYQETINHFREIKIIATDIDAFALDFAGNGLYPMLNPQSLSPERQRKYFINRGQNAQIVSKIRQMVLFAKHNLLTDPPFTKIDLISCRNVLIYFQPEWQDIIEAKFTSGLLPGGYLFLGASETLGKYKEFYNPIDRKWKIYQYKGGAKISATSYLPALLKKTETPPHYAAPPANYYSVKKNSVSHALENLKDNLIKNFAPTCIVIEENLDLFYLGGAPTHFFQLSRGKTSFNIKELTHPPLSSLIAVAAPKVFRDNAPLTYKQVNLSASELEAEADIYDISFLPYQDTRNNAKYVIVTLAPSAAATAPEKEEGIETVFFHKTVDLHFLEIEEELNTTKAILQDTIEELEAANEELQTTNEELMSSNEELQSSNEELQSLNEELITLNSEYQAKNRELSIMSNDIENIFRSTDIGTIFLDSNLLIRKFNRAASAYFNLLDVDIARPIAHISQRFSYPSLLQELSEVMYSLTPQRIEIPTDNGKWIQIRIFPYLTEEQTCQGVILKIIDITEHKSTFIEIARNETNYRKIISFLPFLTLKINAFGEILETITLARQEEVYEAIILPLSSHSSLAGLLGALNPSEAAALANGLKQTIAKAILTEKNEYFEFTAASNEKLNYFRLNIAALLPEKQEFLAAFEDLTDIYNRLSYDRQAKAQAEMANQLKSELLTGINHGVRNPLNGIIGLVALLQKTELTENQQRYIRLLQSPIQVLQKVVKNLLDLSRLEAHFSEDYETLDIVELIKELVEYNIPLAEEKSIRLSYPPQDLPVIYANPIQINRLVSNFLDLLLNLAHDSFIAIELALLPLPQAPRYLQITFLTDALGAKDTLAQLSSLTITKNLIPKTEGIEVSFWVTREIIKQLAVELSLDIAEKEIKAILRVPLPPLPKAAASNSKELTTPESHAQILVVDDEELNREILKDLLELEGWTCDLAENGLEALEKCKKTRYNLVFMDVRMPVLDGIEAIARIREYEKDKGYDTPIVILTAYALPGDKEKYMQSGANEYLAKPVDAKTLLDTIARYINQPQLIRFE